VLEIESGRTRSHALSGKVALEEAMDFSSDGRVEMSHPRMTFCEYITRSNSYCSSFQLWPL